MIGLEIFAGWKKFIILILYFSNVITISQSVQITKFHVPLNGITSESVTLNCEYDLESDELLTLKWYKDENEFFSYRPNIPFQYTMRPDQGFFVERNATVNQITLRNLTLKASGIYRCEVSADRPSFQTVHQDGNLMIIALPDPGSPRLNNIPSTVLMGDTFNGNCTSFRSHPAANLTFYVNGKMISNVIRYEPLCGTFTRENEQIELYTTVLGLRYKVDHKSFQHGKIKLKCVAQIGTISLETEQLLTHRNDPNQYSGEKKAKASNSSPFINIRSCVYFLSLVIITTVWGF